MKKLNKKIFLVSIIAHFFADITHNPSTYVESTLCTV